MVYIELTWKMVNFAQIFGNFSLKPQNQIFFTVCGLRLSRQNISSHTVSRLDLPTLFLTVPKSQDLHHCMVVRVYDFLRKRLFQISVKSQFIILSSMNCKLCSIDNQKEKNQIFEKQLIWIIYSIIEKSRGIMTFWQNFVKTIRLSVDFTKLRNFALKIIWQNFREINA